MSEPLTAEEESEVRRRHRLALFGHRRDLCETCRVLATLAAARSATPDNAGRSPIDVETWNAAIDAATVAIGNVEPVRKVGASWDIARSDALLALLGVRRLSESTGSALAEDLRNDREAVARWLGDRVPSVTRSATPDNAGRSPIDVERLAAALHEMEGPGRHSRPRLTRQICPGPDHHIREAEKVAAEYARLSESTGSEEGR